MNPNESHYCFWCTKYISKSEVAAHQRLGHDVDDKSQAYYEESERASGASL